MDWQQKFDAIKGLCGGSGLNVALRMRSPGDWYVDDQVAVTDGKIEVGHTQNGRTPEDAVDQWWDQHVLTLPPGEVLKVWHHAASNTIEYEYFRWNGTMWARKEKP